MFTKRHFVSKFLVNLTCTQFVCALPHYCAVFHRSTAPCLSTVRSSPEHDTTSPSPTTSSIHEVQAGQTNNISFVFLFEYLITQLRLFAHSAPSKGKPDNVM